MNKDKITIIILSLIMILIIILIFKPFNKKISSTTNEVDTDTSITLFDSDEDINWDNYSVNNISLEDSITITKGGIYNLEGTITNGVITINTNDNVKLVLNNVNITNSSGPAIYIESANIVVIKLQDNTINTLTTTSEYISYDEDVNDVIYSKSDLVFEGNGTLNINAYIDGIASKDNLKINSGTYYITANEVGIKGKDSVYIVDGNFTIKSGKDAIKSTNSKDSKKGFIKINNGVFNINTLKDGIEAYTNLIIDNGVFNIVSTTNKGIKGNNIVISNGVFTIDSKDDSVHANNYIKVSSGTFSLSTDDDGIHATNKLVIDNGNIDILKSYEGIEANNIEINGGNINVASFDDGINAAGENESILTINDGVIYIDAYGDGIDSNGYIYVNGGKITVEGPTNNGNGALDYDKECVVTGGEMLLIGSSGMAENISSSSSIYGVLINLKNTYQENDTIKLVSGDDMIFTYTANKKFSSVVYSSSSLKETEYSLYINDNLVETFNINSITTNINKREMRR